MKPIAITLRIDSYQGLNERRDALDLRWASFLEACSLFPIYLPNSLQAVKSLLKIVKIQGIIFSGGNTLTIFQEGDAPEREEVESFLMEWAVTNEKPILGICRGMQFILYYFGSSLYHIDNHVKKNHIIKCKNSTRIVNSYHTYGTTEVPPNFETLFIADDGIIEAVSHRKLPLKAIMWHPERMDPFDEEDIKLVKAFFNV